MNNLGELFGKTETLQLDLYEKFLKILEEENLDIPFEKKIELKEEISKRIEEFRKTAIKNFLEYSEENFYAKPKKETDKEIAWEAAKERYKNQSVFKKIKDTIIGNRPKDLELEEKPGRLHTGGSYMDIDVINSLYGGDHDR